MPALNKTAADQAFAADMRPYQHLRNSGAGYGSNIICIFLILFIADLLPAISLVFHVLAGIMLSLIHISVPTGSTTLLVAVVKGKDVTKEGINAAMKAASNPSFGYTEEELVSSDIIGITYGSLFDATQTMVTKIDDETYQVQVVSWYDNENSYTSQMVRTIKYFAEL